MRMCVIALLLFAAAVGAQWSELRSKNPPGLEFRLRLISPHVYRRGELIQAEVRFPGHAVTPGQPPPKEQWQFGGLLIEPEPGCGSLAKPCFLPPGAHYFEKFDPITNIGARTEPLVFPLNSYLPALAPGRYRAAVLARKLVMTARGAMSSSYGYANPAEYFVSEPVEFEVMAASAAWIRQTVDRSVALLKSPPGAGMEAYEARTTAARRLQFLDDPAAWRASLDLLPAEEPILLRGLDASSQPARVCELMQERAPAPEQSVSYSYLNTMVQICSRAYAPAPAQFQKYRSTLSSGFTAKLAASLSQKQAEPKATAFATLIQYLQQLRYDRPQDYAPPWTAALTREFIRSFPAVEPARKQYLLELYASAVDSPELLPLLESVLDTWKPGDYYEAPRTALYAIHRIDPARARARILAELTKSKTWLDTPALELLPAAPPMDNALIDSLAEAQRPGGWNPALRMAAIAKYATPKALPRIKAIYESQQDSCQPELMAYFVRVDPAYADKVFRSAPWDMLAPAPPCATRYFERTPPLAFGPAIEKYMAAYLMHGNVLVKSTAARMLGRYGGETARAALWDAFRYFHEYWKGKGAELAANSEGVNLETELRNAIARARNWLATETDLRTIESLCISERCTYETQQDLRAWKQPLRLEVTRQLGGIRGVVAQYYNLDTVEAVQTKLAQFPKGTHLVFAAYGLDAATAAGIRAFAVGRGLTPSDPLPVAP